MRQESCPTSRATSAPSPAIQRATAMVETEPTFAKLSSTSASRTWPDSLERLESPATTSSVRACRSSPRRRRSSARLTGFSVLSCSISQSFGHYRVFLEEKSVTFDTIKAADPAERDRRSGMGGVSRITRFGFVNAYLVTEEDGYTLVDTLLPRSAKRILDTAARTGRPIRRIVLTHAHGDHIGSLEELAAALPKAEV